MSACGRLGPLFAAEQRRPGRGSSVSTGGVSKEVVVTFRATKLYSRAFQLLVQRPGATLELLIAVTDGRVSKKFLTLARRRTGIYVATFMERFGGVHTSYHTDGSYFFRGERIPGPDPPVVTRPPLSDIRGCVQMSYASFGIPPEEFARLPLLLGDDRFDQTIKLEVGQLAGRLSLSIYLLEAGYDGIRPSLPGTLLGSELLRDEHPWILIDLYSGRLVQDR